MEIWKKLLNLDQFNWVLARSASIANRFVALFITIETFCIIISLHTTPLLQKIGSRKVSHLRNEVCKMGSGWCNTSYWPLPIATLLVSFWQDKHKYHSHKQTKDIYIYIYIYIYINREREKEREREMMIFLTWHYTPLFNSPFYAYYKSLFWRLFLRLFGNVVTFLMNSSQI